MEGMAQFAMAPTEPPTKRLKTAGQTDSGRLTVSHPFQAEAPEYKPVDNADQENVSIQFDSNTASVDVSSEGLWQLRMNGVSKMQPYYRAMQCEYLGISNFFYSNLDDYRTGDSTITSNFYLLYEDGDYSLTDIIALEFPADYAYSLGPMNQYVGLALDESLTIVDAVTPMPFIYGNIGINNIPAIWKTDFKVPWLTDALDRLYNPDTRDWELKKLERIFQSTWADISGSVGEWWLARFWLTLIREYMIWHRSMFENDLYDIITNTSGHPFEFLFPVGCWIDGETQRLRIRWMVKKIKNVNINYNTNQTSRFNAWMASPDFYVERAFYFPILENSDPDLDTSRHQLLGNFLPWPKYKYYSSIPMNGALFQYCRLQLDYPVNSQQYSLFTSDSPWSVSDQSLNLLTLHAMPMESNTIDASDFNREGAILMSCPLAHNKYGDAIYARGDLVQVHGSFSRPIPQRLDIYLADSKGRRVYPTPDHPWHFACRLKFFK